MQTTHSKSNLRLKTLRKITNLTGKQLATKIGIKYETLVAIEGGKLSLTADNALLITMATGCHLGWLMGEVGESEHVLDLRGNPFNAESYNSWVKSSEKLADKPIEVMIREHRTTALIYQLVQLFKIAERKCKYEALNRKMNLLISNLSDALDLSKFLVKETIPFLAMGHAAVTQFGSQYGKLDSSRVIDAPDISDTEDYRDFTAAHLAHEGFKAKSSYHDPTEIIKMQTTLSPLFLFQLGDWAGAGKWDAIRNEIAIARGALDLLESKLSKA